MSYLLSTEGGNPNGPNSLGQFVLSIKLTMHITCDPTCISLYLTEKLLHTYTRRHVKNMFIAALYRSFKNCKQQKNKEVCSNKYIAQHAENEVELKASHMTNSQKHNYQE